MWKKEKFWSTAVTDDPAVLPKWTYQKAFEEITTSGPPTKLFNASVPLTEIVLVGDALYDERANFQEAFDYLEALQPRYM